LSAKGFEPKTPEEIFYSPKRKRLLNLFQEYLRYGGFPEVIFLEKKKDELLREYYRAIFYRDILERFPIKNTQLFTAFLKLLIDQNASLFSISKSYNYLRTIGYRLNKSTLAEYINYCKYPYLIFEVELFSYKMKDRLQYPRKIYAIDPGLVNALTFSENLSYAKMLETAVFIELCRRGKTIYYWKGERGCEVDFVVKEKTFHLIQVAWEIDDKVKKREERSLLKAMEELKTREALILTRDHKEEREVEGRKITYLPAWWWLLKKEGY
jgi:hypothetical protein